MADRVIFIRWNRSVVGREKQAMQLFQKATDFYSKLKAAGRIESFEPTILAGHGGELNGFILLKGDAKKLEAVREEDTFFNSVSRRDIVWKALESCLATLAKV